MFFRAAFVFVAKKVAEQIAAEMVEFALHYLRRDVDDDQDDELGLADEEFAVDVESANRNVCARA